MRELELRLRERIDEVSRQRDFYRARAKPKNEGERVPHCVYCGKRTRSLGSPAVCPVHALLVALDPAYREEAA